jgi:hypothetical protein
MPNRPTADRFHAPPERSKEFAHLSLEGLRQYRAALTSEESRVSYWRRILQARLDLVRAADSGGAATVEDLGHVFSGGNVGGTRTALMSASPVDDMPPLPDLATIWAREPKPGVHGHNQELIHDLTVAENQLSAYRTALHARLARATGELIARYREAPDECLTALPGQQRTRRAASS